MKRKIVKVIGYSLRRRSGQGLLVIGNWLFGTGDSKKPTKWQERLKSKESTKWQARLKYY